MSLAERLRPSGHKQDKVLAIYEGLQGEDKDALREALLSESAQGYVFSGGDVSRALQAEGHVVNDYQVSYLRRKLKEGRATL